MPLVGVLPVGGEWDGQWGTKKFLIDQDIGFWSKRDEVPCSRQDNG